jgi:hypothetical protein
MSSNISLLRSFFEIIAFALYKHLASNGAGRPSAFQKNQFRNRAAPH